MSQLTFSLGLYINHSLVLGLLFTMSSHFQLWTPVDRDCLGLDLGSTMVMVKIMCQLD